MGHQQTRIRGGSSGEERRRRGWPPVRGGILEGIAKHRLSPRLRRTDRSCAWARSCQEAPAFALKGYGGQAHNDLRCAASRLPGRSSLRAAAHVRSALCLLTPWKFETSDWAAVDTGSLNLRGVLNRESESLSAFFRGPVATVGVAFAPQTLGLEPEKTAPRRSALTISSRNFRVF